MKIASLLVALALLAAAGHAEVMMENINFTSTASSGTVPIYGTLLYPSGKRQPRPGIVLVAGSGPNNRWEDLLAGGLNPQLTPPRSPLCGQTAIETNSFKQIATAIVEQAGFTVLVYDKRSCIGKHNCSNIPCQAGLTTGCVNVQKLVYSDFVDDAANALRYLRSRVDIVRPGMTMIAGHSQGTTIAPLVAARMKAEPPAAVVLLMGYLRSINGTIIGQLSGQREVFRTFEAPGTCDLSKPAQKALHDAAGQTVSSLTSLINQMAADAPGLMAGQCAPEAPITILGARATCGFWQQWLFATNPAAKSFVLQDVVRVMRVPILTFNSPADLNISPADYEPLLEVLDTLNNTAVNVDSLPVPLVTSHIIPGISHEMVPGDFSSATVSPTLLTLLTSWLRVRATGPDMFTPVKADKSPSSNSGGGGGGGILLKDGGVALPAFIVVCVLAFIAMVLLAVAARKLSAAKPAKIVYHSMDNVA
eukprot:PLAT7043.7.p1 GENE.PLAT7043.7~~PLAT7043.7.p1  ORF type:complete len:477 (+),score=211.06 PLAT7043.7:131-1561(+)